MPERRGPSDRWEREAAARLPAILEEWLAEPVRLSWPIARGAPETDVVAKTPTRSLFIEIQGSDEIAVLERAMVRLRHVPRIETTLPLLVVPYMGPRAREWARDKLVSWLDLSGNGDIRAKNLRVHVDGHANRYAHPGRPGNPFAPKYARVSRVLLADPDTWWRQRDLCRAAELSNATVSRSVGHLNELDVLETNDDGALRPRAPSVLLDTWAQRYSFAHHRVHRLQLASRSGLETLRGLAERLEPTGLRWAATGLAAAYVLTEHAGFRLTTVFVEQLPADLASLGLYPVERGENVWLVVPDDDGVFFRASQERGVRCVHPVQAYLDLLSQPERSAEAAKQLRAERLAWRA